MCAERRYATETNESNKNREKNDEDLRRDIFFHCTDKRIDCNKIDARRNRTVDIDNRCR